ncbi:MAG: hypothetical protein ACN6OC_05335 [Alcaligenes sp.]
MDGMALESAVQRTCLHQVFVIAQAAYYHRWIAPKQCLAGVVRDFILVLG